MSNTDAFFSPTLAQRDAAVRGSECADEIETLAIDRLKNPHSRSASASRSARTHKAHHA
ncbi:hypothetical protein [Paraburkholderia sp.]|uniref:hypothetical protein n=1 Tax=Paraburkholderia sp. TaxID=1926495 RepID=UPI00286F77D9|nr:hypothetical protein [Paraburkholderia sp.]